MIRYLLVAVLLGLFNVSQSQFSNERKNKYNQYPRQQKYKYKSQKHHNINNYKEYKPKIVQNEQQIITERAKMTKIQTKPSVSQTKKSKIEVKNIVQEIKSKPLLNLIAVMGGPGSGKGTHSAYMQQVFGFKHISLGDLFREEIKNNGPLSAQLNSYMLEGKLVPSELGVKLIINELNKIKSGTVLLDGFPRNAQNMETWAKLTNNSSDFNINTYLYFDCPLDVMEARLLGRGKISGRGDDNIDTIRKRLKVFQQNTQEVMSNINKCKTCNIIKIDSNRSIDQITKQLHAKLLDLNFKSIEQIDQTL